MMSTAFAATQLRARQTFMGADWRMQQKYQRANQIFLQT